MNVNSSKIISSVCSTIHLTKLLRAYFVSGTVQGPGNTAVNKTKPFALVQNYCAQLLRLWTAQFSGAHPQTMMCTCSLSSGLQTEDRVGKFVFYTGATMVTKIWTMLLWNCIICLNYGNWDLCILEPCKMKLACVDTGSFSLLYTTPPCDCVSICSSFCWWILGLFPVCLYDE